MLKPLSEHLQSVSNGLRKICEHTPHNQIPTGEIRMVDYMTKKKSYIVGIDLHNVKANGTTPSDHTYVLRESPDDGWWEAIYEIVNNYEGLLVWQYYHVIKRTGDRVFLKETKVTNITVDNPRSGLSNKISNTDGAFRTAFDTDYGEDLDEEIGLNSFEVILTLKFPKNSIVADVRFDFYRAHIQYILRFFTPNDISRRSYESLLNNAYKRSCEFRNYVKTAEIVERQRMKADATLPSNVNRDPWLLADRKRSSLLIGIKPSSATNIFTDTEKTNAKRLFTRLLNTGELFQSRMWLTFILSWYVDQPYDAPCFVPLREEVYTLTQRDETTSAQLLRDAFSEYGPKNEHFAPLTTPLHTIKRWFNGFTEGMAGRPVTAISDELIFLETLANQLEQKMNDIFSNKNELLRRNRIEKFTGDFDKLYRPSLIRMYNILWDSSTPIKHEDGTPSQPKPPQLDRLLGLIQAIPVVVGKLIRNGDIEFYDSICNFARHDFVQKLWQTGKQTEEGYNYEGSLLFYDIVLDMQPEDFPTYTRWSDTEMELAEQFLGVKWFVSDGKFNKKRPPSTSVVVEELERGIELFILLTYEQRRRACVVFYPPKTPWRGGSWNVQDAKNRNKLAVYETPSMHDLPLIFIKREIHKQPSSVTIDLFNDVKPAFEASRFYKSSYNPLNGGNTGGGSSFARWLSSSQESGSECRWYKIDDVDPKTSLPIDSSLYVPFPSGEKLQPSTGKHEKTIHITENTPMVERSFDAFLETSFTYLLWTSNANISNFDMGATLNGSGDGDVDGDGDKLSSNSGTNVENINIPIIERLCLLTVKIVMHFGRRKNKPSVIGNLHKFIYPRNFFKSHLPLVLTNDPSEVSLQIPPRSGGGGGGGGGGSALETNQPSVDTNLLAILDKLDRIDEENPFYANLIQFASHDILSETESSRLIKNLTRKFLII